MKTRLILCLLAFGALTTMVTAQEETSAITIGEKLSLASETLGEERPYWIYLPQSYNNSSQSYPVLYLLDGDAHFHSVSGVVQFMSAGINGNIQIPELIVVAIPNTDRTRDLTPTHATVDPDGKEQPFLASSGGGDKFLGFIREELFPEIDSTYRTLPYRVLVGHSFGGLLALHSLLEEPDMFQSYIAIDPSLWWDDQVLVRKAADTFKAAKDRRGSVYISLANNPDLGFGDPDEGLRAGRAFADSLKSAAGIRSDLDYFEAEDHGSVPLLSLYHGLLHIFEGYKPPAETLFLKPETLNAYFERFSKRLGITFLPPEDLVNGIGYAMLYQMDEADKAVTLFTTNVSNYPESWNVYDSLAEAYMVQGETSLAIENYETSLKLNPDNQNATERLETLKNPEEQPAQDGEDTEK